MRRFLPFACAVGLIVYGCAGGSETTESPPPGGVDGGSTDATNGNGDAPTLSHDGGGADGPALQTCTHNGDCMGPSLCTSGFQCKGGLCVPTPGMPQNCDDGIACTNDTCDAMKNMCVHTPDDTQCPMGSYCDPKLNCVQTLPCTPGDSVCDRLNVDACMGTWSCSATAMHCVLGAKPCFDIPNATTKCMDVPGGSPDAGPDGGIPGNVACSWTCDMGYVHLVQQNGGWAQQTMFTPPPPPGGCDCHIMMGTDTPDYTGQDAGFVDENCDGIDGTIANAIFVDTVSGNDANPGTMGSPKGTIQAGITAAAAASPKKDVYVSKGTYNEHVTMIDGVSLYGGYDASNAWARKLANITTVASTTTIGIDAVNLTKGFTIQFVTITSQSAVGGQGANSIGIRLVNDTGGATVQGCTINVGDGGTGVSPPTPSPGAPGPGGNGQSPGISSCYSGGGGGASVSGGGHGGNSGGPGQGPSGGTPGGAGSAGNGCCVPGNGGGGGNGGPGGPGANGNDSNVTAAQIGGLLGDGTYTTADGVGGQDGTAGSGGGGGGSGGGAGSGCPFSCGDDTSGFGGGGGAGGCGGQGGGKGGGGGGSFGIVIVGTGSTIDQNTIAAGRGGAATGGRGGAGGGSAGGGAQGGGGGGSAGGGGPGGNGGIGGGGGAGSGGTGGPSICVAYSGTVPTYSSGHCTRGGGGSAGGSGGGTAPNGLQGYDSELKGF
jgi:hypothetical protein